LARHGVDLSKAELALVSEGVRNQGSDFSRLID
jgi:hypothetical protein